MKISIKVTKEVEINKLIVDAYPRYWEDATVNGVEDVDGKSIPCRVGDAWRPIIDLDTGKITNWKKGVNARINYKVCDRGTYRLVDNQGQAHLSIEEDYVPDIMCPTGAGYGDYIIMNIDKEGQIQDWFKNPPIYDFNVGVVTLMRVNNESR